MRTFFSNNGPRDRRGQAHAAQESWKEVKAWNPRSWILPKIGFCEDCNKIVEVKLDDPPKQFCMICGGIRVREATEKELKERTD